MSCFLVLLPKRMMSMMMLVTRVAVMLACFFQDSEVLEFCILRKGFVLLCWLYRAGAKPYNFVFFKYTDYNLGGGGRDT